MQVMNVLMGFALAFLTSYMIYPRGNWVVATVVSVVFCAAEALVYAYLAACMPRSGGEYYFQARILSTGTGSVFCFSAIVLGGTMWVAVTGWCAAQLAVGPLLVSLGAWRSTRLQLIAAAEWTRSPGACSSGRSWSSRGPPSPSSSAWAPTRRWQRWFSARGRRVGLACRGRRPASGARPRQPARVPGGDGSRPEPRAIRPSSGSVFAQTLAIIPLASYMLVYAGWSTQQAGETKEAVVLRAQVFIIVGAMCGSAAAVGAAWAAS